MSETSFNVRCFGLRTAIEFRNPGQRCRPGKQPQRGGSTESSSVPRSASRPFGRSPRCGRVPGRLSGSVDVDAADGGYLSQRVEASEGSLGQRPGLPWPRRRFARRPTHRRIAMHLQPTKPHIRMTEIEKLRRELLKRIVENEARRQDTRQSGAK